MSEVPAKASRPVSLVTILVILAFLSLFLEMAKITYLKHPSPEPQNLAPEKIPADLKWRETPEARQVYLAELRKKQAEQASSYAWVDQKKGVVQLPIARAMELVVQENGGAK
jgi:hypothetical protein